MLRTLPTPARLGLTGLMLTVLLGLIASQAHVFFHYRNRDESPEFTPNDIRAAYHGIDSPAPLQASLERGHPETLKPEQRETLLKWLRSGRVAEDYDSIDLGPASPSEIVATSCVSCHSASSPDPRAATIRLASLDTISKLAYPKRISPNPLAIVAVSTHTHALALATLSIAVLGLLWLTRLPRRVASMLVLLNGVCLFLDIACWWVARSADGAIWGIIVAGTIYNASTAAAALLVTLDLWWPRRPV